MLLCLLKITDTRWCLTAGDRSAQDCSGGRVPSARGAPRAGGGGAACGCAPVPSFCEVEVVLEESEEDDEVEEEEEEELEVFDATTDLFEHSSLTWRAAAMAARLRTANKQNVDAPVPQITVELMKEIEEQLVDVPMPQILEMSWQLCRSYHRGHAGGNC